MTGAARIRQSLRLATTIIAVSATARAVPDWVQGALINGQPPWRADVAALQLLNSTRSLFLLRSGCWCLPVGAPHRSRRRLGHFSFVTPYNVDTIAS